MKIMAICGVCGSECDTYFDTAHADKVNLVVTCSECKAAFKDYEKQIGDLEDEIFELTKGAKNG